MLRQGLISLSDSWILVWSKASRFAVSYRFGNDDVDKTMISRQDPSTFELPQQLKDGMKNISDIVLCPIGFSTQSLPFNVDEYGLIKLVACTDNGEIIEALYKHNLWQFEPAGQLPEHMPVLSIPRPSGVHPLSAKYIDEGELDDFIVSDKTEAQHFAAGAYGVPDTAKTPNPTIPGSRSWERLLDDLSTKEEAEREVSWKAILQQAGQRFERLQGQSESVSVQLLTDLVNDCRITDVEDDSRALESWLENLQLQADIDLEPVSYPKASAEMHTIRCSFSTTTWSLPLSSHSLIKSQIEIG